MQIMKYYIATKNMKRILLDLLRKKPNFSVKVTPSFKMSDNEIKTRYTTNRQWKLFIKHTFNLKFAMFRLYPGSIG